MGNFSLFKVKKYFNASGYLSIWPTIADLFVATDGNQEESLMNRKILLNAAAIALVLNLQAPAIATERPTDSGQRDVYLYCKKDNLTFHPDSYGCTWGKEFKSACTPGGTLGSVDKDFVVEIITAYKQCPNNQWWVTRIKVMSEP